MNHELQNHILCLKSPLDLYQFLISIILSNLDYTNFQWLTYTDPVSNVVKKLYVILPFRLNPVTVEIKKKYSFLLVHCILPHRQEVSTSSRSAEMTQPSLYATGIIFHDNDSTIRYSKTRHYKTCLPHFGNMSRKEDKNEVRFYILLVLFSVYFI